MDKDTKRDIAPRIGIGLTTTPNRKHLYDQWMEQFKKHTHVPYHLHVHCDEQYRGVAYSKNQNLRALKDCDFVFLFDDDCWPIHDDWVDFFIQSMFTYALFLNESLHGKPIGVFDQFSTYENCGGVFQFFSRSVIDAVGAFDERFEKYGFEHADYYNRIVGKKNEYHMINGTEKYLRALDYEGINESSLTNEQKQKYVSANWDKYFKEQPTTYIPL